MRCFACSLSLPQHQLSCNACGALCEALEQLLLQEGTRSRQCVAILYYDAICIHSKDISDTLSCYGLKCHQTRQLKTTGHCAFANLIAFITAFTTAFIVCRGGDRTMADATAAGGEATPWSGWRRSSALG